MSSRDEITKKPFLQLILILSFCLISVIAFTLIGTLIAIVAYNFDLTSVNNYGNPDDIAGIKFIQLFSAVGLFIVPPLVYGIIVSKKPLNHLNLKILGKPINYLIIIVLMVVSTPFISWVVELNANMVLPEFLSGVEQWMRSSENQAEQLTKAFLTFDGVGSLFYILLIVAVVPAIGEELLFRGVIQKIFIQWTKNPHWGIWITAILFSALHMQFFGFFPRLLLGLLFGYIFLWSKSLWLPIAGHFINNGSVVIASYFFPETMETADVALFENSEFRIVYYILSFILSALIFYFFRKINKKMSLSNQNEEAITL